jgi:type II secretory pathway component PulC
MILTLGSCAYVIFFLVFKNKDNLLPENNRIIGANNISLLSPSPVFDLKSEDASLDPHARDIFSMGTAVDLSGVENTPIGQLPDHFKIVGILIAHPSQIIIEDRLANKTYFINEGSPQAGIKIMRVRKDQMIINYQGQNISVPIDKN